MNPQTWLHSLHSTKSVMLVKENIWVEKKPEINSPQRGGMSAILHKNKNKPFSER